jgi:hypothetical protein
MSRAHAIDAPSTATGRTESPTVALKGSEIYSYEQLYANYFYLHVSQESLSRSETASLLTSFSSC